jgi:hypothetical protein
MRRAIFTKSDSTRIDFLEKFLADTEKPLALYFHPKNRASRVRLNASCEVKYFAYEDITKTDEWLTINALIGDSTALIMDNFSRYPRISSEKFKSLQRIEKRCPTKAIADIVPFTLDIQYLYTPFSLLGRDILGYSHYYAFRENYHESDADGNVRFSHDFDLLTDKIAPFSEIDYSAFLCPDRETILSQSSGAETLAYQQARDELFAAKEFSPQRVVTKLADIAHAFDSRIDALIKLASKLSGKTLVLTNLASYAKRAQKACKDAGCEVTATSYQLGASGDFDNCIYLESPIVKTYFLLDVESRLREDCKVFHMLGETKVDQYLYKTLTDELTQINDFTKELNRAKRRQASPKAIPAKECTSGRARANQLALF